jgi:hypothetical protein
MCWGYAVRGAGRLGTATNVVGQRDYAYSVAVMPADRDTTTNAATTR